jgi:glycosyltransferase involved in cell wall biosynthesis
MACATPVILVPSYGLDEYVADGYNCLFTSGTSKQKMVQTVRRLIESPKIADNLVKNGLDLANKFKWNTFIDKWIQLIKEAS